MMGKNYNYYRNLGYALAASVLIHLPILYYIGKSKLERETRWQESQIVNDILKDKFKPLVKPHLREKDN